MKNLEPFVLVTNADHIPPFTKLFISVKHGVTSDFQDATVFVESTSTEYNLKYYEKVYLKELATHD
jgi:hypothetical protein